MTQADVKKMSENEQGEVIKRKEFNEDGKMGIMLYHFMILHRIFMTKFVLKMLATFDTTKDLLFSNSM